MRKEILFLERNQEGNQVMFDPIIFLENRAPIFIKGVDNRDYLNITNNPREAIVKINIQRDTVYKHDEKYLVISTLIRNFGKSLNIVERIIKEFDNIKYEYNIVSYRMEILLNKPSNNPIIDKDSEIKMISKYFRRFRITKENNLIIGYTLNRYSISDLIKNKFDIFLSLHKSKLNKFVIKLIS